MKVYKNFEEMFAHLRGKVEEIKPKEYVPKKKAEPKEEAKEEPKAEPKPKKSRKKKEN